MGARVEQRRGADAGVDRATVAQIESRVGVEAFLGQIRDSLKSGEFAPVEVRQVMIPKASGKLRKLGIPTVADRVVQASLKAVLEPIFEADFTAVLVRVPAEPARAGRDRRDPLPGPATVHEWVLEADIQACFDEIEHTALMDRMRQRIKDKRVLRLVKAFLKAGVMTASGDREETLTGTPQGGILSPLLANIALSALDDHFDQQWHRDRWAATGNGPNASGEGLGNWRLIRYADDFVVMVSGQRQHAEALREEVAAVLAPLGLRLAPEKTRVVHIDEGFDFLGFHIRRDRKRGTQKHYVYTTPSKKAMQAIKDKVRAKTHRSTLHLDLDELITSLNQTLRGWANYFRHGVSKRAFNASRPARLVADRGLDPREVQGQDPTRLEGTPPPLL